MTDSFTNDGRKMVHLGNRQEKDVAGDYETFMVSGRELKGR